MEIVLTEEELAVETWKSVPIEPFTFYSVSDHGRVRNDRTGKILRPGEDTYGYLMVIFNNNRYRRPFKVHRLVMSTFEPRECSEEYAVNHRDRNIANNRLSNLEWVTEEENIQHAIEHGGILKRNQIRAELKLRRAKMVPPSKKYIKVKIEKEVIRNMEKISNETGVSIDDFSNETLKKAIDSYGTLECVLDESLIDDLEELSIMACTTTDELVNAALRQYLNSYPN